MKDSSGSGLKLILLGPPGAGKGTQAAMLAEDMGVPRVSSGDLFRDHQSRNTELGRLAKSFMERGVYVPDDVTIGMVMDWIDGQEGRGGYLLDGFPRTLAQAEALGEAVKDKGGIDIALNIRVGTDELVRRLSSRLICRGCQTPYSRDPSTTTAVGCCEACGGELYRREDDRPEAIGKRLETYFEETEPLVDYYRQAGNLREVDGEGTIEEVRTAIGAALG
jgi:adenylate kinase